MHKDISGILPRASLPVFLIGHLLWQSKARIYLLAVTGASRTVHLVQVEDADQPAHVTPHYVSIDQSAPACVEQCDRRGLTRFIPDVQTRAQARHTPSPAGQYTALCRLKLEEHDANTM